MSDRLERAVQRGILKMMGVCYPNMLVHHSPNGAHLSGGPTARFKQMGALKGDGMKPGWPDLQCLWNGGCLFLEVKREKGGKLSDEQRKMLDTLEGYGFPCAVVCNEREAFDFLKGNGAPWSGVEWAA